MSKKLPSFKDNFSDWYNEVVYLAELADHSPVRGTIVIRPYGWAIWENIRNILDKKIKDTGHQNATFPLFIPKSFLEKEAKHVEGFSPELAIVTYAGGKELEEPLVVRPTSETIIHYMFAQWIKSWRDLPMKINQWANVVRWELRPRPFLRTTEFHWQEGHTAHETAQEAEDEATLMLNEYLDLIENYLAIPGVPGIKSESEKFAGADKTYTIETMMPDGKALQMCTSHLISQSFAKAFGMMYQNRQGQQAHPYLTSWGATTRLIGALIMVHGDDKGLVLPPAIAPIQVVIIPIYKDEETRHGITQMALECFQKLSPHFRVHIDTNDHMTPGAKYYHWELRGVPTRIELGPRDLAQGTVVLADRLGIAKETIRLEDLAAAVKGRVALVQKEMSERARKRLQEQWHKAAKLAAFGKELDEKGGFWQTGWCRSPECEHELKKYKATTRCIREEQEFKTCFNCDKASPSDILVAKSY